MCEPISTVLALGGLAAGALASKPKKPPPAVAPATPAAPAREAGATVRIGDGGSLTNDSVAPTEVAFVSKRKQAVAIGGLGRSGGLSL